MDIWREMQPDPEEQEASVKPLEAHSNMSKLVGGTISPEMVKASSLDKAVLERGLAGGLVEKPHMDALLSTGYFIIYKNLVYLLEKSLREKLDATETRQLESYLKLVRTLGQEERDQRTADGLAAASNEELRKIVDGEDE